MKKLMLAAAAFAVIAPFTASADELKPITVVIKYDHALLGSDAGAEIVLGDIRQQARSACTSSGSKFGRSPAVDRTCAHDVMAKAAVKILKDRESMGLETAPAFARVATIETASYEQR
jgi:UrcA family protein